MNILDFYKMNNFFEQIIQTNVSNSSEIIQGSLVGSISGGLLPSIQGPQGGSEAIL